MAALAAVLIGGAIVISAAGAAASGSRERRSAEGQAAAQKRALERYAKALRSEASTIQGGMSQAQQRTLAATGAAQRASEGQRARDEVARGGSTQKVDLEKALAGATQAGAAQQQRGLDQMSQQQALANVARRDALKAQARQAEMQSQAISPYHLGLGAAAGTPSQVANAVAQPMAAMGGAGMTPYMEAKGTESGYGATVGSMPTSGDYDPEAAARYQAWLEAGGAGG